MTELPRKLNLGSGKDWKEDYLNVDINPLWDPDVCVDMSLTDLAEPFTTTRFGFCIPLAPGHFDEIRAHDVLEHVPNLVQLMTNCIRLLRDGGEMRIIVPYDLSYGAWQDPTHVRAFNERSWPYYTDWFWYLGWRDWRFDLTEIGYEPSDRLDLLADDGSYRVEDLLRTPRAIDSMHVTLTKRATTDAEKAEADRQTSRKQG